MVAEGVTHVLELGAGRTLGGLVRQINRSGVGAAADAPKGLTTFLDSRGQP